MPEPLSEEKLAELEGACKDAPPGPWSWRCSDPDYAALVSDAVGGPIVQTTHGVDPYTPVAVLLADSREAIPSLLAEVRLGREALKALDAMEDAYDHVAHCRECGETSVQRCAESEGENSAAAKAIIAREECSRILRKAGRR